MQAGDREIQALYRALGERGADSWQEMWDWWYGRVASWVRRHPQFRYTGEEVDYFVNRAFEKLWRAVDAAKLARFQNPAQLIQYFKMCVHSVILDELRGPSPETVPLAATAESETDVPAADDGVEDLVIGRVRRDELWKAVSSHVKSEDERLLLEAALVRGLPPREIAGRYAAVFGSVQDVYRTKRNLLHRLSRDKNLRDLLS